MKLVKASAFFALMASQTAFSASVADAGAAAGLEEGDAAVVAGGADGLADGAGEGAGGISTTCDS
jgi:hypothetical protein